MTMTIEEVGDCLARLRQEAELTQNDLAKLLTRAGFPYSKQSISSWESGKSWIPMQRPDFADALARALNMETRALYARLGYFPAQELDWTPRQVRAARWLEQEQFHKLLELITSSMKGD